MLFLPVVGLEIGLCWYALAWLCGLLRLPALITGLALCAYPYIVTGFLHLDGFMDVCDAVLSRRDLETRRRILKDSHCGAFAVICMVLLAMGQWSAFLSARSLSLWGLALIPVASRSCAALAVLTLRPLDSSQYSAMQRGGGPVWFAAVCLALSAALPLLLAGSFAPAMTAVGCALAVWYGYRQLDGMSGDVSGFALTVGELWGVLTLAVWR